MIVKTYTRNEYRIIKIKRKIKNIIFFFNKFNFVKKLRTKSVYKVWRTNLFLYEEKINFLTHFYYYKYTIWERGKVKTTITLRKIKSKKL